MKMRLANMMCKLVGTCWKDISENRATIGMEFCLPNA